MANGKPGRPTKCSPEFKANAVDYALASGKTYAATADPDDEQRAQAALEAEQPDGRHPVAVAQVCQHHHDEDLERGVRGVDAKARHGAVEHPERRQHQKRHDHEGQGRAVDEGEVEVRAPERRAEEHDPAHEHRAPRRVGVDGRVGRPEGRLLDPVGKPVERHEGHGLPGKATHAGLGAGPLVDGQRPETEVDARERQEGAGTPPPR